MKTVRILLRVVLWAVVAVGAFWVGAVQRHSSAADNTVAATRNSTAFLVLDDNNPAQKALKQQMQARAVQQDANQQLAALLASDQAAGLADLAKLKPGPKTQSIYESVFEAMAEKDPATAAALALALDHGPNRDAALKGVMTAWNKSDAKGLLDWAKGIADSNQDVFQNALMTVVNSWDNPKLAAQYLDVVTDPTVRSQAMITLTHNFEFSSQDPADTLAWLNQVATGNDYLNNIKSLIGFYAQRDPAEAAKLFPEVSGVYRARATVLASLATTWGQSDPQAAMAWAQTLSGNESATAANSILSGWAAKDPNAVLSYINGAADPSVYNSVIPSIADSIAATDPKAAMDLVQSLPDGAVKNKALDATLATTAKTDLADAWNYAVGMDDSPDRNVAIASIISGSDAKSLGDVATLVMQLPAGPAQLSAVSALSTSWLKSDSSAFNTWMAALPQGDVQDAALVQFSISPQGVRHPLNAFNKANSITNPDLRATQVQVVLNTWAAKSPQSALDAVATANLTAEQKATIVQTLTKNSAAGN